MKPSTEWWRYLAPLAVIAIIALLPVPAGLENHTWLYFAVFTGVIVGLILEPVPGAVVAPWCCRCKWLKDTAGRRHRGVLPRSCGAD